VGFTSEPTPPADLRLQLDISDTVRNMAISDLKLGLASAPLNFRDEFGSSPITNQICYCGTRNLSKPKYSMRVCEYLYVLRPKVE
jgi:hypothetical protein